jgi:hypothetical protein
MPTEIAGWLKGRNIVGQPVENIDDSKAAQGKQFECRQSQKLPGWKSKIQPVLLAEQEAMEWVPHPCVPQTCAALQF